MTSTTANATASSLDPIALAAVRTVTGAAASSVADAATTAATRIAGSAALGASAIAGRAVAAASAIAAAARWVWQQERELALLGIAAWTASGLALWLL